MGGFERARLQLLRKSLGFVSGHGFSRAARSVRKDRALAPEGRIRSRHMAAPRFPQCRADTPVRRSCARRNPFSKMDLKEHGFSRAATKRKKRPGFSP